MYVSEEDTIVNKMFKHVIALAQDIGLECVIEGVETIDQLDVLRLNNCFIVQGYFFDRPLPVAEFEYRMDRKVYPEGEFEGVRYICTAGDFINFNPAKLSVIIFYKMGK